MCRCQVCNKTAVASVATGPRWEGAFFATLRAGFSWWSSGGATRNRRAPPRRATNPLTGRHRAKNRLLRQVHPPDARGTMADQPRRYWCTYQRHCGNAGAARVRATARGRRPKERRAPTQGLEGTNPRTARRYFLTRVGSTT